MIVRGGQRTTHKIGRSEEGERVACVGGHVGRIWVLYSQPTVSAHLCTSPRSDRTYIKTYTIHKKEENHASVSVLCLCLRPVFFLVLAAGCFCFCFCFCFQFPTFLLSPVSACHFYFHFCFFNFFLCLVSWVPLVYILFLCVHECSCATLASKVCACRVCVRCACRACVRCACRVCVRCTLCAILFENSIFCFVYLTSSIANLPAKSMHARCSSCSLFAASVSVCTCFCFLLRCLLLLLLSFSVAFLLFFFLLKAWCATSPS